MINTLYIYIYYIYKQKFKKLFILHNLIFFVLFFIYMNRIVTRIDM